MLNEETLQNLQNNPVAHEVMQTTGGRATVIPERYRVQDLNHWHERPQRFTGAYRTGSIADFIAYANANKQADSALYIDQDEHSAVLIIDHGTHTEPRHGEHKAILNLKPTPAYLTLQKIHEGKNKQQNIAEWIEDWGENLTVEDDSGESMSVAQATAAIRRITIAAQREGEYEDNDNKRKLTVSEQVEAKMRGKQPKTLRFTFIPFDGFEPVQAEIRLIVLAIEGTPIIRTRVLQKEAFEEKLGQTFKSKLQEGITGIPAYVGTFKK